MQLIDRTVLVTGGSSGIGFAVASAFAARGCRVVLCARDEVRLCEARRRIPDSFAVAADLSSEGGREHLVDTIRRDFADLSVLVNAAGVMRGSPLASADRLDGMREQVETNFVAPMALTASLLHILVHHPEPAIVNVTSGVAYVPIAATPVYSATKAALHSFTLSLRLRLAGSPVRVFELIPTAVDTPMLKDVNTDKASPDEVAAALIRGMERDVPEIRVGRASQLYAMSRLAPRFITRKLNPSPGGHS